MVTFTGTATFKSFKRAVLQLASAQLLLKDGVNRMTVRSFACLFAYLFACLLACLFACLLACCARWLRATHIRFQTNSLRRCRSP
jgi:hypothetical protein